MLAALQPLVATEGRTSLTIAVIVLALGLLLGLATPPSGGLPPGAWSTASNIIGWTYFSAWSVSFWPQILLNFQRGSVEGLSFDFLLLNLLGFTCYSVYNGAQFWNATVIAQYQAANKGELPGIHANDVFFGLHAVLVTALTIGQCLVLRREPGQTVSWPTRAAVVAIVVALTAYASVCSTSGCGATGWWTFMLVTSYVKLAISCSKYIPQVFINIRRKSTAGWSIHNVMLDFTGGLLSVAQQIGDAQSTGNWAGMCVRGRARRAAAGAAAAGAQTFFF